MEPIKEEKERLMAKYLDGIATEDECIKLMDELIESKELRTRINIMAAGLNRMTKNSKLTEINKININ